MPSKHLVQRLTLACLTIFVACAQHVPMVDEASEAPLPFESYTDAARSGSSVYRIVPQDSLVLIRVTRAGAMKRLGHDHAVASEDIQGFIEVNDDASASRADIVLPLRNLLVDTPKYRERLGLVTDPSESDVAGTYTNMLKMLMPELHPWVAVHARIVSIGETTRTLSASITMNGRTVEFVVPVDLDIVATRLLVSGDVTIRQSEFGLAPFQAAGGLLRVADELKIEFSLVGMPLNDML